MSQCPSCLSDVPADALYCSACGESLDDPSRSPTQPDQPGGAPASATSPVSHLPPSDPSEEGRFLPGTVLAGRYRIVALLGKGGMGEVYRAYDSKLGQTVALKFLPEDLARAPGRLARFYNEVRTARQISHPNVCRVYDIGETEGMTFLSMEYIDGEDLASLLRRIGRLPQDKATDIARQICAGLAAAHERGVLHRDLKPGNIMLDGRGRAHITDFGLSSLAGETPAADVRAGTPAYMAPEQLAGEEVSVRSDIYALGLLLYEIYTGRKVFPSDSMVEIRRRQDSEPPVSPASIVDGLDPAVERALLRCLERDPGRRPASALAVAASLPGGDPLQAALAAGETPSPEMVAATGGEGTLRPAVAVSILVFALAGVLLAVWSARNVSLAGHVPLDKPRQVLLERSREIIQDLGYTKPATDRAWGFSDNGDVLERLRGEDDTAARWAPLEKGRPAALTFWYRESPSHMVPLDWDGRVSPVDPAFRPPGMRRVILDTRARLVSFDAVPPALEAEAVQDPSAGQDWAALFTHAGLEFETFTPAAPLTLPRNYGDTRAAWEGPDPDNEGRRLSVQAASLRGRPVYFRVYDHWTMPQPETSAGATTGSSLADWARAVNVILVLAILIGAALLARRNIRLGRGDRRGAFRLALLAFSVILLGWMLTASHVPNPAYEFMMMQKALGLSLFIAGLLWIVYMALEPYVRRHWPYLIVSTSRLLAGRFRDPLIGRDVLLGIGFGVVVVLLQEVRYYAPGWLGLPPARPQDFLPDTLMGARHIVSGILGTLLNAAISPILILFLILLFRVVLRRRWAAATAVGVILGVLGSLDGGDWRLSAPHGTVLAILVLFVLLRFGLLTLVLAQCTGVLLLVFPLTLDPASWFVGGSMAALGVLVFLALYGFFTALAGRPLVSGDLFES